MVDPEEKKDLLSSCKLRQNAVIYLPQVGPSAREQRESLWTGFARSQIPLLHSMRA